MIVRRGNIAVGRRAEYEICRFLMRRGQAILERNYRMGHLEIDVITLDTSGIHFVEVKSLVGKSLFRPEDKVDSIKRKRLAFAANSYMRGLAEGISADTEAVFDIAAVRFDGGRMKIRYYQNAYIPLYT